MVLPKDVANIMDKTCYKCGGSEKNGKRCRDTTGSEKRKLQYLGHIMRGPRYKTLQLIVQGKIEGKKSVGRRRMSWFGNLQKWFNVSISDLFKAASSKTKIAMIIVNLLNGDGT